MRKLHQQFIANQWLDSESENTVPVHNPATGIAIATLTTGSPLDVKAAVDAAYHAFPKWRDLPSSKRADYLRNIAKELSTRRGELVDLSVLYSGKLKVEAELDLDDAIDCYHYYASLADTLDAEQGKERNINVDGFSAKAYTSPLGVAALITPWNFPLVTSAWKIAPALAAGCTVVWKPSELVPLPEQIMGNIAQDIGLPAGVLNIVHGDGPNVGAPLCASANVAKISFTGSNEVGERVMQAASVGVRPVSLELGGKSPIIVLADADIKQACEWVWTGIFSNAGQMCSATSRLVVHHSVAPALYSALLERATTLLAGDPLLENTTLAPVVSAAQRTTIQQYQKTAQESGLVDLFAALDFDLPENGFFVRPAIYQNVPADSPLWTEEIFGPVLCVQEFDNVADAIRIANSSDFGLAATIISGDISQAEDLAVQLESGVTWINSHQFVPSAGSWGGFKHSGIGRELGPWGLEAFQGVKHIYTPRQSAKP